MFLKFPVIVLDIQLSHFFFISFVPFLYQCRTDIRLQQIWYSIQSWGNGSDRHSLNQPSHFLHPSSQHVKGVMNTFVCSFTTSCVRERISGTSFSLFSDKLPVLLSSVLPFSFIVWPEFVSYLLPFPNSQ